MDGEDEDCREGEMDGKVEREWGEGDIFWKSGRGRGAWAWGGKEPTQRESRATRTATQTQTQHEKLPSRWRERKTNVLVWRGGRSEGTLDTE